MSLSHSPRIVTNGLVLCLDAADPKSYPGSGTVWYDRSGNGNDSILVNSPTHSDLNKGNFNFNSTNQYVNCGQILNNNSYTKIAWFRPMGASQNIISGSESNTAFWMAGTTTTLYSGHNGAWRTTVSYSPGNMLYKWWHGSVTFNNSTGFVLYLNGEQVDSNESTDIPNGNGTIRIGAHGAGGNLFNGDIPCVQLYNHALSPEEILQNYNATKSRFGL